MSKVIHRYELTRTDEYKLIMPLNAEILSALIKRNDANISILVAVDVTQNIYVERSFQVVGTGFPIENYDALEFIATIERHGLLWHLFEDITKYKIVPAEGSN